MGTRRLARTITITSGFDEADQEDRAFWHAQDPLARLEHLDELRRLNYGDDAAAGRLQRVLEVARRPRLLTSVSGLRFDEAHARASRTSIGEVPITVIGLEDLRRNKRAAGRPRDLADLEELPER